MNEDNKKNETLEEKVIYSQLLEILNRFVTMNSENVEKSHAMKRTIIEIKKLFDHNDYEEPYDKFEKIKLEYMIHVLKEAKKENPIFVKSAVELCKQW